MSGRGLGVPLGGPTRASITAALPTLAELRAWYDEHAEQPTDATWVTPLPDDPGEDDSSDPANAGGAISSDAARGLITFVSGEMLERLTAVNPVVATRIGRFLDDALSDALAELPPGGEGVDGVMLSFGDVLDNGFEALRCAVETVTRP